MARAAVRDVQSRDPRIAASQGVNAGLMVNNYLDNLDKARAVDTANATNGNTDAAPADKPLTLKVTTTIGSSMSRA